MANEAAFLQDLFADLDSTIFDLPPSSPPVAVSSPRAPGPAAAQPRAKPSASLVTPKPRPAAPLHLRASPTQTSLATRATDHEQQQQPQPLPSSPFWNDPLSRPIVGTPPSTRHAAPLQVGGMKRGGPGGGGAKKRVSPEVPQRRKHVKIEVEEDHKENQKLQEGSRDLQGKRKPIVVKEEEVDFDALMDGMDWEEGACVLPSSGLTTAEVKVRCGLLQRHVNLGADLRRGLNSVRFPSASSSRVVW